ncbi:uncharacterized protein LOC135218248 [Macrobrachium nipponense]|uniref:uncharacterized protein LOC135218248 n=1 Tax=Macrobrachium nipponense TaxID=159736 RepID=UPI0030C84D5F
MKKTSNKQSDCPLPPNPILIHNITSENFKNKENTPPKKGQYLGRKTTGAKRHVAYRVGWGQKHQVRKIPGWKIKGKELCIQSSRIYQPEGGHTGRPKKTKKDKSYSIHSSRCTRAEGGQTGT